MLLRTRSMFPIAALGVMLGALRGERLMSQPSLDGAGQRRAVESFITALRLPADANRGAAGIGVRLLWDAANFVRSAPSYAERAEIGIYGTYIPTQSLSTADAFTACRLGVIGDMRLVETPLAGMVEPVLSLGAGVWHSTAAGMLAPRSGPGSGFWAPTMSMMPWSPGPTRTAPLSRHSVTALELSPGAGVRVPVGPAAAMLFAVHDAMTFGGAKRRSLASDLGLRFRF